MRSAASLPLPRGRFIASDSPEFVNNWRTMQWWREQILNYFDAPVTNAFSEGVTNKIKVMKDRSFAFSNAMRYRHKSCWGVGAGGAGLAEPPRFAKSPPSIHASSNLPDRHYDGPTSSQRLDPGSAHSGMRSLRVSAWNLPIKELKNSTWNR